MGLSKNIELFHEAAFERDLHGLIRMTSKELKYYLKSLISG